MNYDLVGIGNALVDIEVQVDDVRVVNVKGKTRRTRTGVGRRSDWKKAYVRLAEGQDIDFSVTE